MVLLTARGKVMHDKQTVLDYVNSKQIYLFNKSSFLSTPKESFQTPELIGIENKVIVPPDNDLKIIEGIFERYETTKNQKNSKNKMENGKCTEMVRKHNVLSESIYEITKKRRKYVIKTIAEISNQYNSVRSALGNLEGHSRTILKQYNTFQTDYIRERKKWLFHIGGFDSHVMRLKGLKLHPKYFGLAKERLKLKPKKNNVIITDERHTKSPPPQMSIGDSSDINIEKNTNDLKKKKKKSNSGTLFDCIPLQQLRKWKKKCQTELNNFHGIFSLSKNQIHEIEENVFSENDLTNFINLTLLSNNGINMHKKMTKINSIVNSITQEYGNLLPTLKSLNGITKEVEEIINTRNQKIKILRKYDMKMNEIGMKLYEMKKKTTKKLFYKLKKISQIQYMIKKLRNKLQIFKTILKNLKEKFIQVELIYYFPGAYSFALLEIARRNEFLKRYNEEISKARKKINLLREQEDNHRKEFINKISTNIPPFMIKNLKEKAPEVSFKRSDHDVPEALPKINEVHQNNILFDDIKLLFLKDKKEGIGNDNDNESDDEFFQMMKKYQDVLKDNNITSKFKKQLIEDYEDLNDDNGFDKHKILKGGIF